MLRLVFHLALTSNEGPLYLVYLSTDFIRLLGYLVDGVPAQLVNQALVEESELPGKILVPLLFIFFLLFCIDTRIFVIILTLLV